MFRLDMSATFWAEVRFDAPAATGGGRQEHAFVAEFPRMTADDLEAFGRRAVAEQMTDRQVATALFTLGAVIAQPLPSAPMSLNMPVKLPPSFGPPAFWAKAL